MSDRIITTIWWEPAQGFDVRAATILSDPTKIRLDPADHRIKLKIQQSPPPPATPFRYPTDLNLSARSRTYSPNIVAKLLILEVQAETPTGTSIGLRLFDGTDELYWDGGAWAVAGPGDWNTETEVNENIDAFDVETSRQFAVVLNLVTTDDKVTPVVDRVLVLWESERDIDWAEDLLIESFAGMLQDELTMTIDTAYPPLPADTSSVDLSLNRNEADMTFLDVPAAYDITVDPQKKTNIVASFDFPSQVVTFTGLVPAGNVVQFRIKIPVNVAWDTSQDFTELGKLPQLVLRDADAVKSSPYPSWAAQGIVRKDNFTAVEIPAPQRMTYLIQMEMQTNRTVEQMRLHDAVTKIFTVGPPSEVGPFLISKALDRRYRLFIRDEFRAQAIDKDAGDVRMTAGSVEIRDAGFHLAPAVDSFAVKSFNLLMSRIDSAQKVAAEAAGAPVPTTTPELIKIT